MKYLSTDELRPGQMVAHDVYNANKQLLIRENAKLEMKYIQHLKKHKVDAVCIYEEKDLVHENMTPKQKEDMKELIRPKKKIIFKFCYGDFMMNALFDAVVNNEVGVMWNERNNS